MKQILVVSLIILFSAITHAQRKVEYVYYADGSVKYTKEHLKKGIIRVTAFYEDGGLKEIAHFTMAGKKHGAWKAYDADGTLTAKLYFLHNRREGFWEIAYLNLNRQVELVYDSNKLVDYSESLISAR